MKVVISKRAPGNAGRIAVRGLRALDAEIDRLNGLSVRDLRAFWSRRFRKPPPPIRSADLLHRLIAWRLQVDAFGDLDAHSLKGIKRLSRCASVNGTVPVGSVNPLKAGTVLVREWRGVEHRVLVLDDGFEHRDKRYRSLTSVARAITGTRWSGPRFFGLDLAPGRGQENGGERP